MRNSLWLSNNYTANTADTLKRLDIIVRKPEILFIDNRNAMNLFKSLFVRWFTQSQFNVSGDSQISSVIYERYLNLETPFVKAKHEENITE